MKRTQIEPREWLKLDHGELQALVAELILFSSSAALIVGNGINGSAPGYEDLEAYFRQAKEIVDFFGMYGDDLRVVLEELCNGVEPDIRLGAK